MKISAYIYAIVILYTSNAIIGSDQTENSIVNVDNQSGIKFTSQPSGFWNNVVNFFRSNNSSKQAIIEQLNQHNNDSDTEKNNALVSTKKSPIISFVAPLATNAWNAWQHEVNPSNHALIPALFSYVQKRYMPLEYLNVFCEFENKLLSTALLNKLQQMNGFAKLSVNSNNVTAQDISGLLEKSESTESKTLLKKIFDRMWVVNGVLLDALAANDKQTISCVQQAHKDYVIPVFREEIKDHEEYGNRSSNNCFFYATIADIAKNIHTDFTILRQPKDNQNSLVAFSAAQQLPEKFNNPLYYESYMQVIRQAISCHQAINTVLSNGNFHQAVKLSHDDEYVKNLVMPELLTTVRTFKDLNNKHVKLVEN